MILGIDLGTRDCTATIYDRGNVQLIKSERILKEGKYDEFLEKGLTEALKNIKEKAENILGESVDEAVISISALMNNNARKMIIKSAKEAGLKVHKLVNISTAIATVYIMNEEDDNTDNNDVFVLYLGDEVLEAGVMTVDGRDIKLVAVCGDYDSNDTMAERIRKLIIKVADESQLNMEQVRDIIVTGKGYKDTEVRKLVENILDVELEIDANQNEEVVIEGTAAMGAAMWAAIIDGQEGVEEPNITEVVPFYFGNMRRKDGEHDVYHLFDAMIKKNVTIPAKGFGIYRTGSGPYSTDYYQAEDLYGKKKIKIGEIRYVCPRPKNGGSQDVHRKIYYDDKGNLRMSMHFPENGITFYEVITDDEATREEILNGEAFEDMACMTKEDAQLIERAEELYMELDMNQRSSLANAIEYFEYALEDGRRSDIVQRRQSLIRMVDYYEGMKL